jgi:3-phenylpropionate/trans-cinnamate dioxygenase ferredoxin component
MPQATTEFRTLGPSDALTDEYVVPYYLADLKHRISVARVAGKLYGFDDLCSHDACPLSAGMLEGTVIMCQCSGCRFELATGAVVNGPATEPLGVYEVRELDGSIQARV